LLFINYLKENKNLGERRYAFLTNDQQRIFNGLNAQQQAYIKYRGMGYNKKEAYMLAYPNSKNPRQASTVLTARNPEIEELVECFLAHKRNKDLKKEDTPESKEIDKIAEKEPIELEMLETTSEYVEKGVDINGFSGENAKRLQFYRKIMNGQIVSTSTTKKYDKDGNLISTTVVESDDIETRIKARKEVDRILGLAEMIKIGSIQCTQDIKVLIVDASKKELPPQNDLIEIQEDTIVGEEDNNEPK
jgi:hypothetical protein